MSPERIQGSLDKEIESFKRADLWSVGVIMCLLISGKSPFEGDNIEELSANIIKGEFNFNGPEW
jgi:serine/threonine protein kinase